MTGFLILAAAAVVYALLPGQAASRLLTLPRHAHHPELRQAQPLPGMQGDGHQGAARRPPRHGFYQHVKGEPDRAGRMGRINPARLEAEHERKLLEQDS